MEGKHMSSGGARARSGPAPDPNALRRDRKSDGEWLVLPSRGREGDPPQWPLEMVTDREMALWATLWARPVALIWERDCQVEYVALYVRSFVEAEQPGATANLRTLVKQLAGELLLSIPSMRAAHVLVATDELAEKRGTPIEKRASARDRMKVVNDGVGG